MRFNSKTVNSSTISNGTSQILFPLELDRSTLSQGNKWACGLTHKEMKNVCLFVWGFYCEFVLLLFVCLFLNHLVMHIPGKLSKTAERKAGLVFLVKMFLQYFHLNTHTKTMQK